MQNLAGKKIVFIDDEAPKGTNEDHVQKKLGLEAADIISGVQLMRLEWKNWFVFNVTDAAAAKLESKNLPEATLKISDRDGVPAEKRTYKKNAPGL